MTPDGLTKEDIAQIAKWNAEDREKMFRKQREEMAAYEADCLASWSK